MTCTTHHHACECREAEFARVKAERDQALRDHDEAYGKAWDYKVERDRLRGDIAVERDRLRAFADQIRRIDAKGPRGGMVAAYQSNRVLWESADEAADNLTATLSPAEQPPSNPGASDATGSEPPRAQVFDNAGQFLDDALADPVPPVCPSCGSDAPDVRLLIEQPQSEYDKRVGESRRWHEECTDPWHPTPTQGEGG